MSDHKPDVAVLVEGDWIGWCRVCRRGTNWVSSSWATDAGPESGLGHWRHNPAPHAKPRHAKVPKPLDMSRAGE